MASADNGDPLPAARDALVMAVDVPERERARQELAGAPGRAEAPANARPLPSGVGHSRPASSARPAGCGPGRRATVRGHGRDAVGAGGAAKSTLASTLALDVAYGGDLVDPSGLDGLATGFSGLFDVRPSTRTNYAGSTPS